MDSAGRREGSTKTTRVHLGEVSVLGKLVALQRARWIWDRPQKNKAFMDFEIQSRNY